MTEKLVFTASRLDVQYQKDNMKNKVRLLPRRERHSIRFPVLECRPGVLNRG